ncbi:MAG: hypothetical protein KBC16_03070 [Candidatus Pacebacteria bacterium]|nr:hypothetical protein [Candidatus Paceibacterota bacterium]
MTDTLVRTTPTLNRHERWNLAEVLGLPETASDEAIMREFARNYWWNHGNGMKDGDPLDLVCKVSSEKLLYIAQHYESDYRGIGDRKS